MKMIKCDACKDVVNVCDSARITINPLNLAGRFEFVNGTSKTRVENESFDLCKTCLMKTLRKYYGENFGKEATDR